MKDPINWLIVAGTVVLLMAIFVGFPPVAKAVEFKQTYTTQACGDPDDINALIHERIKPAPKGTSGVSRTGQLWTLWRSATGAWTLVEHHGKLACVVAGNPDAGSWMKDRIGLRPEPNV